MPKKPAKPAKVSALRRRAEERLRTTKRDVAAMSTKDVQHLVHELQVHQLELEMQNEELRQAQAELEVARARYADLYEFSPVGHLTLDAQGHILEANLMATTLLSLTRNKLKGKSLVTLIAGEDRDVVHHHIQQVLKGGTQHVCEVRLPDKPGLPSWILLKSRAIPDESGRLTHWQTAFLDTSLRKRDEAARQELNATLEQRVKERTAALAEANERWDWVVRATDDGVWDWDLLHDTTYFSPRWKEMHGFQSMDSLESLSDWSARIHPEDRQRVIGTLAEYLAGKLPKFWEEYRIQRKDGTYFWVFDRGIAIFNDQSRAVRMVGAETDLTWRKEAEEALRRREYEFRMLADNVPAFFAYIDRDRRYRFVNKQYEELFGRSNAEIRGMPVRELFGPEDYDKIQPYLGAALRGEPVSFEYPWRRSGTCEQWFSAQYVPDRDDEGKIQGLFALLTDVTKLKSSEAALRERQAQLRELGAKLLRAQEEERRRISRDLHDDVMQRMGGLALELHDLASSTASQDVELQSQLKSLGASAEQLTTDLQQMAHQLHPSVLEFGGLEMAVRAHVNEFGSRTGLSAELMTRDVPRDISLDHATCLYRVLQEGLQNVQKHAKATTVLVRLVRTSRGLGLCIHDDGCGIENSDGVARRKGLGMISMAERIAMLNGTFHIESKRNDGTELHAWVPLEQDHRGA